MPSSTSEKLPSAAKRLLKTLPEPQAMKDTLLGLLGNSDQAAAITGAAYLDHILRAFLKASFTHLNKEDLQIMFDGPNAILGSFSSRIRIAYATGLIDKQSYHDLLVICDIRNCFAHSLHNCSFNSSQIMEDCFRLKTFKPGILTSLQETAKQRFFFTTLSLYTGLRSGIHHRSIVKALMGEPIEPVPLPDIL